MHMTKTGLTVLLSVRLVLLTGKKKENSSFGASADEKFSVLVVPRYKCRPSARLPLGLFAE